MNSLETLGLLPSFVERLNEEELLTISRQMAKALQFIYHPDRRADGYLKSVAINEAIRHLESSPYTLQKEKQEYVRDGPGQRETRAMREGLEILIQNIAIIENKIEESKKKKKFKLLDNWLNDFYKDGSEDFIDDLGDGAAGFYLRSVPGRTVVIDDWDSMSELKGLEEEQAELEDEYAMKSKGIWRENTETLRKRITECKGALKADKLAQAGKAPAECRMSGDFREKTIEELKRKEAELAELRKRKGELKQKIAEVKKQISALRKTAIVKLKVDEDGCITSPKTKQRFRLLGSADSLMLEKEIHILLGTGALRGGICIGRLLISVDENGKTKVNGPIVAIEGLDAAVRTSAKKASRQRKVSTKTEAKEAPPAVTALARKEEIRIDYAKNPFETVGLLPSLVRSLNDRELKEVIKIISRGLERAFHPDMHGGASARIAEINSALSLLDDPAIFSKAKSEYEKDSAGGNLRNALVVEINKKRENITKKTKELATAKMDETRRMRSERQDEIRMKEAATDIFSGVYTDASKPHPSDYCYLHKAKGFEIFTDGGHYLLENHGFDVFAVSEGKRIRLMGCVQRGLGKEEAEKMLADGDFTAVQPRLYNGCLLVSLDTKKVFGHVTEIKETRSSREVDGEMKKDAKKIARGISDKIKRKDRETIIPKPKTRNTRPRE